MKHLEQPQMQSPYIIQLALSFVCLLCELRNELPEEIGPLEWLLDRNVERNGINRA